MNCQSRITRERSFDWRAHTIARERFTIKIYNDSVIKSVIEKQMPSDRKQIYKQRHELNFSPNPTRLGDKCKYVRFAIKYY